MDTPLPLGKLPPELLARLVNRSAGAAADPRVRLGPGVGLDCAVIDFGSTCLVAKTDPITFVTDEIGWYAVHICSNDIATAGAAPRWFLASLLLPEGQTTPALAETIFDQIRRACDEVGAVLVGGHTEITYDLRRPIVIGTMLGEVAREALIVPSGARPGDTILVTKGIPIEGTAILAREKGESLHGRVEPALLERARGFLHVPGISVVRDAAIAARAGGVTAMHDPTEGGLASALWELADASRRGIRVEVERIPVVPEGQALCSALGLDPLAVIASGALLLSARPERAPAIQEALAQSGINSAVIGEVVDGDGVYFVHDGRVSPLLRPARDEIARLFGDD